jgi:HD-GYP domain-containing protein (c-di-GMP phosphodiesterase class II)
MWKAKAFTAFLLVVSVLLTMYLLQGADLLLDWRTVLGLLLFFAISLTAESQPLMLPGAQAHITVSGLSYYATIALFPPVYAAAIGALAVLLAELVIKKKALIKGIFNTAQIYIAILISAIAFRYIEGTRLDSYIPYSIFALTAAVTIYFVANTSLVSFLLSQINKTPFWRTWSTHYRWEILYIAASIPVALLLVVAYQRLWLAGPLLLIGPLFLLRQSYAQYIQLKTTYTETVKTLIKVIEMHDTYTAGHSLRVAEYAKRLAMAAKLSIKESEKVEIAAYLHDLGKVDLAITHLVRKPGKLTPDEKRRVQLHPLVSADIAAQVTYFRGHIEKIIRHHHENFNGTGYPHGLRGYEIPVGSRIILIADAFDAMTSNRMYRSALDFEKVHAEFIKYSNIQFDPQLVSLFFEFCVKDESQVIPQIEIPYEDLLSTKRQAASGSAAIPIGEAASA